MARVVNRMDWQNRRVLATRGASSIGSRRPYHLHASLNQAHCPAIFMLAQRVDILSESS